MGPLPRIDLAREAEFSLGGLLVRPASREVVLGGKGQTLQPRVMQVLVALARRQGEVVSRDDLVASCWDGLSVSEDAINRCIGALRRLAEQDTETFAIETIAKVGYRLTAAERDPVAGEPSSVAPHKAAVRIAVLPFANMSSDPEQEYFADGLSEELMNQLAQLKELRVTGRTSSFAFKGKTEDFQVIGDKLGVAHVLEGSVRKAGQRLRITAQLIQCSDGFHLWSQTYDRDLDDVFAIQDEIACAVAAALKVAFGIGEAARTAGGTENLEAYDKYLRAQALTRQLGPGELTRAASLYREALTLDPDFALAWYGLYTALAIALVFIPEQDATTRKQMTEASARIAALTPNAWWTHAMRAQQLPIEHRWAEAETAASAAVAEAPRSEVDACIDYAFSLFYVGRCKEAVESLVRARQADPLSLAVSGYLQVALNAAGRPAAAQVEFERSKDLAGDRAIWEWYALLRLWRRKDIGPAAVKAQFNAFLSHESLPMALSQIMADRLEDESAARIAIREAFEDAANQDSTRMGVIAFYADHFGDKDLALGALHREFIEIGGTAFATLWFPYETSLRADPRFKDIVRDLGLVDYWRSSGKWGDFARPVGDDDFEVFR